MSNTEQPSLLAAAPPAAAPRLAGYQHRVFKGPNAGVWEPCTEDFYLRTAATGTYGGIAGAQDAEVRAVYAGAAPVLWCLHLQGPDEVHAAPSKAHAEKAIEIMQTNLQGPGSELVRPIAAIWPHSAESHAEDVGKFIAEWLLPRGEVEAAAAITAPAPVQSESVKIISVELPLIDLIAKEWDGIEYDAAGESIDVGAAIRAAAFANGAIDSTHMELAMVGERKNNPDDVGCYDDFTYALPIGTKLYAFIPKNEPAVAVSTDTPEAE